MNPALDSRARFEAWHAREHYDITGLFDEVMQSYRGLSISQRWVTWQAAIASMAAPEGWLLVPIEPTKAMVLAGAKHTERGDDDEPYRARGQAIVTYMAMLDEVVPPTPQDPIAALAAKEKT